VVSSTVRKFATLLCLLGDWYIFHLHRLRKSIKSCGVRPRWWFIRNITNRDNTHSTSTLWRQQVELCSQQPFVGDFRRGRAHHPFYNLPYPFPHWLTFSTHRRCMSVPLLSHSLQLSEGDILIRCSLSLVGRMSCIVVYHAALSADIGAVVKFFHIFCQSDYGHILAIRISCGVKDALCIVCNVVYRRFL